MIGSSLPVRPFRQSALINTGSMPTTKIKCVSAVMLSDILAKVRIKLFLIWREAGVHVSCDCSVCGDFRRGSAVIPLCMSLIGHVRSVRIRIHSAHTARASSWVETNTAGSTADQMDMKGELGRSLQISKTKRLSACRPEMMSLRVTSQREHAINTAFIDCPAW